VATCRRLKLDPCLTLYISVQRWIKDLKIKSKTLKLLEEKIRKTLKHTSIINNFLNRILIAQWLREQNDKCDYLKLRNFFRAKETFILKRQSTEWKTIFASHTSDKELITRIYMVVKKLNSRRLNDPMRKRANELNENCKERSANSQ
jgi:hypothetical protein